MGGDGRDRGETSEEETRVIHRWIALSELLVPRRLRRDRGVPRGAEAVGRKGGERESDPEPGPAKER